MKNFLGKKLLLIFIFFNWVIKILLSITLVWWTISNASFKKRIQAEWMFSGWQLSSWKGWQWNCERGKHLYLQIIPRKPSFLYSHNYTFPNIQTKQLSTLLCIELALSNTADNTPQRDSIPFEPGPENIRISTAFSAAYEHVLLKWKTVCQSLLWIFTVCNTVLLEHSYSHCIFL